MSIREILAAKKSTEIHSIAPDQFIHEAVALMARHGIGSLVVKEDGKMAGLLTERHIVRGLSKTQCNLCNTRVRDVMAASPITGQPDDSIDQVRKVMTENHISHLPVVDESGLVGIISFYDVARSALSDVEFENRLLKRYIKNWPEEEA